MVVQMYRLQQTDPRYQSYESQFNNSWNHPGKSAKVKQIFLAEESGIDRAYRGKRFNTYRNNGNFEVYFHGTQRACNIGRWGTSLRYCKKPECRLCSILWHSFDVKFSGCMFGAGIYTTPCSSKADIYARNHHLLSSRHAMLICRVVSNYPRQLGAADSSLASPGSGYDSVRGLTVLEGGTLNYSEVVVYRNDAIVPIGVIFYTRNGWSP
ncbi:hypothetical protein F5X97DRAFT_337617 [Nemania serpens]|nr:hypothetical protein F5X97DRAFT_337617 [Nemania serpens]